MVRKVHFRACMQIVYKSCAGHIPDLQSHSRAEDSNSSSQAMPGTCLDQTAACHRFVQKFKRKFVCIAVPQNLMQAQQTGSFFEVKADRGKHMHSRCQTLDSETDLRQELECQDPCQHSQSNHAGKS